MWFWFKIRLIFWKVKIKLILISNIFDVILVKISEINIIFKWFEKDVMVVLLKVVIIKIFGVFLCFKKLR